MRSRHQRGKGVMIRWKRDRVERFPLAKRWMTETSRAFDPPRFLPRWRHVRAWLGADLQNPSRGFKSPWRLELLVKLRWSSAGLPIRRPRVRIPSPAQYLCLRLISSMIFCGARPETASPQDGS